MLRERMREAAAAPTTGRERNDIKQGYYSVQGEYRHRWASCPSHAGQKPTVDQAKS